MHGAQGDVIHWEFTRQDANVFGFDGSGVKIQGACANVVDASAGVQERCAKDAIEILTAIADMPEIFTRSGFLCFASRFEVPLGASCKLRVGWFFVAHRWLRLCR